MKKRAEIGSTAAVTLHPSPITARIGWGPFFAVKLLEFASGLVGLIVLAVLVPHDYVPSPDQTSPLQLLGGAIFVSVIYFVLCGYVIISAAAFAAIKRAVRNEEIASALLAAVFLFHAVLIAIWTDYGKVSFFAFIVLMAVWTYFLHRFAFKKLS